ncbi:MAG: hypothetical protein ACRYF3_04435 [Janthinobacterium lividum]
MPDAVARAQGAAGPLALLRVATAPAHERLDTGLDVLTRPWDLDGHREWLSLTWGLFNPLERGLRIWAAADPGVLDVAARARADFALADLGYLGATGCDLEKLRECPDTPVARSRPAALGVCYVLDGSTLGGALITRAVTAAGVPAMACTSLTGREGAGRRWRETMAAVEDAGLEAVDEMAEAAIATFAAFEHWLAPLAAVAR